MHTSFRLINKALTNVTIRGLKSVRSGTGTGTLKDVETASDKATLDNVIKALEAAEENVSHPDI